MTVSLRRDYNPVVPVEQDPRHLVLGAFWKPSLPVELSVISERLLGPAEGGLHLRIIGESHWVSITGQRGPLFHEILACVPLPAGECSIYHSFSRLQGYRHRSGPYSVEVRIEPMSKLIALHGSEGDFLQVDFPNPYEHDEQPFTRLWWAVSERRLCWWTTHIYATERGSIAVLSESRYERSPLL